MFRLEAGALATIVLYVGLLAVVLASHGRGFTKLGPGGVEPADFVGAEAAGEAIADLRGALDELSVAQLEAVAELTARLDELEQGLQRPRWIGHRLAGRL